MTLLEKLYGFLNHYFFSIFRRNSSEQKLLETVTDSSNEQVVVETNIEEVPLGNKEKINISRRTLMTRLYMLEQKISIFKESFATEYASFTNRIETLRNEYISSLGESNQSLTYEINPERDGKKLAEVIKLETEVNKFIEKEVKFDLLSRQLQRLIRKLNILYNVSIYHSQEHEMAKVLAQIERAMALESKLIHQFQMSDYLIEDLQIKERFITLMSYLDFEIFKITIRNSTETPDEILKKLGIITEFSDFDYISAFKAFIEDELTDLGELLEMIKDTECSRVMKEKYNKLFTQLEYSLNINQDLLRDDIWDRIFNFENSVLELLKSSNVDENLIKIGIISKMDINVKEKEVLCMPKTTAYLALTSIFSKTGDDRILLSMKLLRNVSDEVTYKEIYFILVLFDALQLVKNTSNELFGFLEKYMNKYPYSSKTLQARKEQVFAIQNKHYFEVFSLETYDTKILETLDSLEIDFYVNANKIYINEIYFNGLHNVTKSLQTRTNN